jgi:hypothetical protein
VGRAPTSKQLQLDFSNRVSPTFLVTHFFFLVSLGLQLTEVRLSTARRSCTGLRAGRYWSWNLGARALHDNSIARPLHVTPCFRGANVDALCDCHRLRFGSATGQRPRAIIPVTSTSFVHALPVCHSRRLVGFSLTEACGIRYHHNR